ncbi:MAG: sulfatase-like hydrolase/transferase, partial [Lachnospiraceae bacterium]|nr:sulfatase-like hydrolase/transferase [Lachnospiraceae bacterium]
MKLIVEYLKNNKKRLILALIWAVMLVAIFAFFYIMKAKNEFYVSFTDKLTVAGCTALSTLLLIFRPKLPRWLSCIFEVLCVVLVPVYLFHALEPVINPMESYVSDATFFNILILEALFAVIYALTANAGIAVGLGGFITYALYLTDYFTIAFRGTPFVLSDIRSARTAAGVMGNYRFVLSGKMMVIFYVLALFTALGFFVSGTKKLKARLITAGVALSVGAGIFIFLLSGNNLSKRGFYTTPFVPIGSAYSFGFPLNTICSLKESFLKAPEGYSASKAETIMKKYESTGSKEIPSTRPNIIVVMNESFTDFDYLETVETTEPTIPKFKALKENCVKGTLVSSIYGGNTPNSEFEFLTGCTLAFLPTGIVTFQQLIDSPLPTFTTHLKDMGYGASAIHLYNPEYFSRNRIYPLLGFDEFININNATVDLEWFHDYVWDRCSFDAIEQVTEKSGSDPCFSFCVTIQNHGGYWQGLHDIMVTNAVSDYADDYASLLKITDDAF